jgi:hypothetical protein
MPDFDQFISKLSAPPTFLLVVLHHDTMQPGLHTISVPDSACKSTPYPLGLGNRMKNELRVASQGLPPERSLGHKSTDSFEESLLLLELDRDGRSALFSASKGRV